MRLFRSERVGSVIQQELSKMIIRDIELSGGLITVVEVVVDKKMEHARVHVSVIPASAEAHALRILNMKIGEFQHALNHEMGIRPMPLISFVLDHGNENAARVAKLLLEEKKGR
ncbi:MAG: 30S ribosome-binding factor RbfA [Minisyncoccia bacterium]|jgi:ribosome-binding factor A